MPYQTELSGLQPPFPNLGLIEGFFGKGWSWEARARYAQWLPRHGYGFYIYAPKEDGYLRKHWALPWPEAELEALRQLARQFESEMELSVDAEVLADKSIAPREYGRLLVELATDLLPRNQPGGSAIFIARSLTTRRISAMSSAAAAPKWMAQKSRAMSSMESSGFHMSR